MNDTSTPKTVAYVDDINLRRAANRIPVVHRRASMVHDLIKAYGLLEKMTTVECVPAQEADVRKFHSLEYVSFLKTAEPVLSDEQSREEAELEDDFGLGFDCPVLPSLWSMALYLAGGSLTASGLLTSGSCKVAINWCGGWHHAQRDSASGFCYVNDIVLAIMHLRQHYSRVAYVDLDVHHGDGVENAFAHSRSVLTVSLHLKEGGFFPGTGGSEEIGLGDGQYFALNVPYKTGIRDESFIDIVKCIVDGPLKTFSPECVVVQCGGDALALDQLGGANLSLEGYAGALRLVLQLGLPTLLLGGGGYESANVARLWTYLTALVLEEDIDSEIPEHCFFELYGPSFDLHITPSYRRDENCQDYMDIMQENIKAHGEKLRAKLVENKQVCQLVREPSTKVSNVPCYRRKNSDASENIVETSDDESCNDAEECPPKLPCDQIDDQSKEICSHQMQMTTCPLSRGPALESVTFAQSCEQENTLRETGAGTAKNINDISSKKRKLHNNTIPKQEEKKGKPKDTFEFDDEEF